MNSICVCYTGPWTKKKTKFDEIDRRHIGPTSLKFWKPKYKPMGRQVEIPHLIRNLFKPTAALELAASALAQASNKTSCVA